MMRPVEVIVEALQCLDGHVHLKQVNKIRQLWIDANTDIENYLSSLFCFYSVHTRLTVRHPGRPINECPCAKFQLYAQLPQYRHPSASLFIYVFESATELIQF